MNYFKPEFSDVLGHLKSEQSAKNEADARSRSLATELDKINQQMQKDAPHGPTQLPTSSQGPLEYHMGSPPGLGSQKPKTRMPEGGPPDDHDDDDDSMTTMMIGAEKTRSPRRIRKRRRRREIPLTLPPGPPSPEMS